MNTLAHLARSLTRGLNVRGIPRLLYITRRLTLGSEPSLFDVDGFRLCLDPRDYFQVQMFYGRYAPDVFGVLSRHIKEGDTVLDVGAHIGFFSLHAARLAGRGGKVFAFEPDPRAYERLTASVAANGFNVTPLPYALSSIEGEIDFYLSPVLGWSTAVSGSHLTGLEKTTVRTAPLDLLVGRGEIPHDIQFIKIDTEGFEVDALKGMERTLREARPLLLIETNEMMLEARGESVASLYGLLKRFGYREGERLAGDALFIPA